MGGGGGNPLENIKNEVEKGVQDTIGVVEDAGNAASGIAKIGTDSLNKAGDIGTELMQGDVAGALEVGGQALGDAATLGHRKQAEQLLAGGDPGAPSTSAGEAQDAADMETEAEEVKKKASLMEEMTSSGSALGIEKSKLNPMGRRRSLLGA